MVYPPLEPGDIFLSSGGNGWLAKLGRLFMRSHWTHAGLIEDRMGEEDYGILESIPHGIGVGLLGYHYGNDDVAVYRLRSKYLTPGIQTQIIFYAKYRGRYHYDYGVADRVAKQLGLRNTLRLLIQMMMNKRPAAIPHIKDHHIVCSELIQECYEDAEVPLIDSEFLLLPRDIATLRRSKLVQVYGEDKD